MITQSFLTEFEVALFKAYNRSSRNSTPITGNESNFAGASKYQNEFITQFMKTFQEQHAVLERELRRGSNDPTQLMNKINSEVEAKLRNALFHKPKMDQTVFDGIAKELRRDIRSVFYSQRL